MTPQFLGLLASLVWPIPMIVALFMVIRAKGLKYRVVWAIASFVGVGAFWMEDATGKWGFILEAVNILGPGRTPGFFKACIPVGAFAVIALVLKVRAVRLAAAASAKTAEPPTA